MLVLILIWILIFGTFYKCNGVHYYRISNRATPHVAFLGSTHGNEPAGYFALKSTIKNMPNTINGTLTIIPAVNQCGLAMNTRNNPYDNSDINRNYPGNTLINSKITKLISAADWVVDLHEGWGFHHLNPDSVGSGIYPGDTPEAKRLCDHLVKHINMTITEPHKKFVTFALPAIHGSLREHCIKHKKHYILVETSGIDDIQPLPLRIAQQEMIIREIISFLLGGASRPLTKTVPS